MTEFYLKFPKVWQVVFSSFVVFGLIYGGTVNAQETVQLTEVKDIYPFWSPDGTQIVFHSNRAGGAYQVYVMNADGTELKKLTSTEEANLTAVWSPDGKKIAFQSERDGNREIYVMNPDGTNQTRLTVEETEDSHPKWSSDSQWIIFDSVRGNPDLGRENIYLMRADGSEVKRVTEREEVDSYSSLSPDGTKILFRRILPEGGNSESGRNSEVFIMNRDGSGLTNLSNHADFDGYPSWSPNGEHILFSSNRNGETFYDFNVYVIRPDGTGLRKLTETISDVEQVRPMFSPDGKKIVFNRDYPDGRVEIHVMGFTAVAN